MGVEMLLFVIWPNIVSVIAGVVILSVVISFAYTCQYSYFEQTPESSAYGEGRAMGVYSVFESLGQTVGPIAYGVLLTFGYQNGITIFCLGMFALLLVFVAVMLPSAKKYKA
jgi:MFS family permease